MRRGTLAKEETSQTLDDVTPQQAELVSRRIFGAFEYRIAVAAGARESLRLASSTIRTGPIAAAPFSKPYFAIGARCTTRRAISPSV